MGEGVVGGRVVGGRVVGEGADPDPDASGAGAAPSAGGRTAARAGHGDRVRALRAARRLALAAVFEAEFGQRIAGAILERHLAQNESDPVTAGLARAIVSSVVSARDRIDAEIGRLAPHYPVVSLARMDRALLRCALGEVLHSGTTPARVAIAEWVELARIYSGDPMRRLMNGVLGRIASEMSPASARRGASRPPGPRGS